MKLLRFGPKGQEKPRILDAQGQIRDLSAHIDDLAGEVLCHAGLQALAAIDLETLPMVAGNPRLGPCVGRVGKFICIGLNYADHAAETGAAIPKEPIVFNKWISALSGPNDPIQIPRGAVKTDWEVELGIIIGTGGSYISPEAALSHVAGYCVINDVSERSWQLERSGTWDKGKGFDSFGPLGPWLVTPDEAADVGNLAIWLEVDGHRYQDGSTRTMIFDVRTIISHLSHFMSLQPGDVISTGTPPGVGLGQRPPVFLKGGEVIRLGIEGLGEQRQQVLAAS